MTREEAKSFIINISYKLGNMAVEYLTEKDGEKMREAIKALEQETILGKIRAEIEQLPTKTRINWNGCCPDIDYPEIEYVDVTKNNLLAIIDKY